jgi:hypothetical protein
MKELCALRASRRTTHLGQGAGRRRCDGIDRTVPIAFLRSMRVATVVQPLSARRRSKRRDLASDPCDDEAETLVFDLDAREPDEWLIEVPEGAAQPQMRAHASAFRPTDAQLALTMIAALIGAMAAAWSIERRPLDALGSPEALMGSLAEVYRAAIGERPSSRLPPAPLPPAAPVAAARPLPSEPIPVAPAAAAAVAAAAAPSPVLEAAPATDKTPVVHKRRQRSARPSSPAGTGTLRINSRPWSVVHVDGRRIGSTPQTAIELPAGRHRVVLVSDQFDLKRTLTIEVRAGKTVTRSVELIQ